MADYEIDSAEDVLDSLVNATALITPHGGDTVSVEGVFDREYVETLNINGERPVLWALTRNLPYVEERGCVRINDVEYRVAVVEPDGTGMTRLVLEKQ